MPFNPYAEPEYVVRVQRTPYYEGLVDQYPLAECDYHRGYIEVKFANEDDYENFELDAYAYAFQQHFLEMLDEDERKELGLA